MDSSLVSFMISVTILDRGKANRLSEELADQGTTFNLLLQGRGTAKKGILSYLGLENSEKDVLMTGVSKGKIKEFMEMMSEKLELKYPGKGIAFAVPMHGIANPNLDYGLQQEIQEQEEIFMESITHNLIMVIMNHGYADEVMDTAIDAGAPGGTVLRARGAGYKYAEKFLGITIQPDKDLLMILADEKKSLEIMPAIVSKHGIGNDARAIVFSLPVCHVMGISKDKKE